MSCTPSTNTPLPVPSKEPCRIHPHIRLWHAYSQKLFCNNPKLMLFRAPSPLMARHRWLRNMVRRFVRAVFAGSAGTVAARKRVIINMCAVGVMFRWQPGSSSRRESFSLLRKLSDSSVTQMVKRRGLGWWFTRCLPSHWFVLRQSPYSQTQTGVTAKNYAANACELPPRTAVPKTCW